MMQIKLLMNDQVQFFKLIVDGLRITLV